jgi:PKD repeat protein
MPTAAGDYPVTVQASNSAGSTSQNFTITVTAPTTPPLITSPAVTAGTVGQVYTYDVEASGSPPPTFSLTQSPGGMAIDSSSGLIAWMPTAAGDYPVTVQASNSAGSTSQNFTITVTGSPGSALFADDFNRADSGTVGNGWVEVETTTAATGVQGNRLCFLDTSDVTNRPMVRHSFQKISSGQVRWDFDFDWDRIGSDNVYRLFMQLGDGAAMTNSSQDGGVGVNLVWTSLPRTQEILGYRRSGALTNLQVVSGAVHLSVLADLNTDTYQVLVGGTSIGSGIPFDKAVDLDTVRLFTDGLNETSFSGRCFDNLTIEVPGSAGTAPVITSPAVTAGTVGQVYTYDVEATGSPAPTFSLTEFPSGMAIDPSSGLIAWMPTMAGDYPVTVEATNSAGTDSQSFTLTVVEQPVFTCDVPVRIMPLGDSITAGKSSGIPDADDEQWIAYRKDLYDRLLLASRNIDFVGSLTNGQFYAGFDPQHEGHSGWTDSQVSLNIYNWLQATPADVVLLHIGTNNLDPSPADVEHLLNEIDRYEADANRPVIVVLARIINRNIQTSVVTQFNNNVAAMASARTGDEIIIVDMENGAGLNYNLQPGGDMWDNLHPYATGYAKMANVWFNALTPILPECSAAP